LKIVYKDSRFQANQKQSKESTDGNNDNNH